MAYVKTFFCRIWAAFHDFGFWIELLIVLPLSALGIWIPWWFDWGGETGLFLPGPWFTFGVATLMLIFCKRFFMSESEDRYLTATRFILVFPAAGAALLYAKSFQRYLETDTAMLVDFDYSQTKIAILMTLFVWFVSYIQLNKYDRTSELSPLGGKI